MVSFVAWQERPGIHRHSVLVAERDLDEDCINIILGWLESVRGGGGICIVCDRLVPVDASPSSCGSQGWCEAAPQKLQLQLALLPTAAVVAGSDCVFSGAVKQEITGTFSAVSLREKKI